MSEPLIARDQATEVDDRRTATRTQCVLEVAIANAERGFLAATVLDISSGGVKLLVDPPPAPGDVLRLTFLAADGRLFQLKATAVHYIEHGATWSVGCRFERELNEKEIAALL
jgi:hypothetical protein